MEAGAVAQVGTFDAVMACGEGHSTLREMMAERRRIDDGMTSTAASATHDSGKGAVAPPTATPTLPSAVLATPNSVEVVVTPARPKADASASGRLMTDEDRNRGSVPLVIYLQYLRAMGMWVLVAMFASVALTNIGNVCMDYWLGYWSDRKGKNSLGFYIGVYAALSCAVCVLTLVFMLSWAVGSVKAAASLHEAMLRRVLRSPMFFFDSTPAGRILNRFSSDIDIIDRSLPTSFSSFMGLLFKITATLIMQAIVFPYTLLGVGPAFLFYGAVQVYYRASMRESKRVDSITKSPVYAHLSEALTGLSTLRAYDVMKRARSVNERRIDANQVAYLTTQLLNRWLGFRLDCIGSVLIGVTSLVAVLTAGGTSAGLVGLALSYAMVRCCVLQSQYASVPVAAACGCPRVCLLTLRSQSITGLLNWLVRGSTETETYLSCVERVLHYAQLPVERCARARNCRFRRRRA